MKAKRIAKRALLLLGVLAAVYLVLLWPDAPAETLSPAKTVPFAWNRDQLWTELENRFVRAKERSCDTLEPEIDQRLSRLASLVSRTADAPLAPDDPVWDRIEERLLTSAPLLAVCPRHLRTLLETTRDLQHHLKRQSENWPAGDSLARRRLYRLIYGSRTAVEQIMLQTKDFPAVTGIHDEPSSAPSFKTHGIVLHSGDILVSRGGAATSALIARGSDFPGNFSHAALLYVDAETHGAYVVEALIESGVVITAFDDYLKDKKLRLMVLRPRSDLPALVADPLLAHKAAEAAYLNAGKSPIDYDFQMDFNDTGRMFCSEVVYAAYNALGIRLWAHQSTISEPGTARWLGAFGVRHFRTLEPSDLEYDYRLVKIAEWRDPQTLYKDYIDNAATDALLEKANNGGLALQYSRLQLPAARLVKGYSVVLNAFGARGPIPKGMSATAALRNLWYSDQHALLGEKVAESAGRFTTENGYTPPYWVLVKMAREYAGRLQ